MRPSVRISEMVNSQLGNVDIFSLKKLDINVRNRPKDNMHDK